MSKMNNTEDLSTTDFIGYKRYLHIKNRPIGFDLTNGEYCATLHSYLDKKYFQFDGNVP